MRPAPPPSPASVRLQNGRQELDADDHAAVASALSVIPNNDLEWNDWNRIGMATWAATGGSEVGRKAFAEWSAKSSKNDQDDDRGPLAALQDFAADEDRIWHSGLRWPASIRRDGHMKAPRTTPPSLPSSQSTPSTSGAKFDPPTLPRGVLPQVIEEFAFDRGMTMGCDMAGIAVGALAVCAAAIPDDIKLQPKKHDTEWQEAARLWVALVGDPSTMKTPMIERGRQAAAPHRQRNGARQSGGHGRVAQAVERRAEEDAQAETASGHDHGHHDRGDTGNPEGQPERRAPGPGRTVRLVRLDGQVFRREGRPEGPGVLAAGIQRRPVHRRPRHARERASSHNLRCRSWAASSPSRSASLPTAARTTGFCNGSFRSCCARPWVAGTRPPGQAVFDYSDLISDLRELKPPTSGTCFPPLRLTFDDGALAIREELEKKHLDLAQLESLNRKLTSHFGKYNGIFARLCVVWHCVEHVSGRRAAAVITEATARRVASFLHGFLLPHALAFYAGVLGLANDHDRLANVADYILAHKLERITNRDVQRGDRSMRSLKRHETEAIFEQLEALGWVTRTPGPRPSDPPHWVVNPVVHQKFAERAEAEKKRRGTRARDDCGPAERSQGMMMRGPSRDNGDTHNFREWQPQLLIHKCHHCPLRHV